MPSPPKSASAKRGRGRPLKSRPQVSSSDEESPPVLERQDIYPTTRMKAASRGKTENPSLTQTLKPKTAPGTTKQTQSVKSEPNDEFYVIEKILRRSRIKRKVYYQVKWEGFSMEHCTWEPAANLKECSQLIEEFEKRKSGDSLSKNKRPRTVNAESNTNNAESYAAGEYFESSENDPSESDPKDKDDDWVEWHAPKSVKKTASKSKSTSVAAKSRSKVLPKVEVPDDANDRNVMEPADLHPEQEQDMDEKDAMTVVFARPGQTGSGTDYLVKYNDLSYDWVPSAVAIGKYPQQIIRYFSELMQAGSFEFESIR